VRGRGRGGAWADGIHSVMEWGAEGVPPPSVNPPPSVTGSCLLYCWLYWYKSTCLLVQKYVLTVMEGGEGGGVGGGEGAGDAAPPQSVTAPPPHWFASVCKACEAEDSAVACEGIRYADVC
jgi:hypothetical protein